MPYPTSKTPVILLTFANDDGRSLRQLDQEQKELRQLFQQAEKEGKCRVHVLPAATADDLIKAFQEHRDQIRILHYGGHSNEDEIFLQQAYQQHQGVKAGSLAEFLALHSGLELIFLNSCLSFPQAEKYRQNGAKTVLATHQKIGDEGGKL